MKLMDIIKNSVYSEMETNKTPRKENETKKLNSDIPSIMFTDSYFEITNTK